MKASLLAPLSLLACSPIGEVYSVRRAELLLLLPCEDSGDCDGLVIPEVPFEREDQVDFELLNEGERALTVELSLSHSDFAVSPATSNVAASGSTGFTVTYAPSVIDPQETTLLISHNAGGPAFEITVSASTNPDADSDGYLHLLAPRGDDCNDFNAQVNPGVLETWYDGVDQDCDGGSDYDQDGDGHDIHTRPDGDDCDDEQERIHPGAPDPLGDDIDQDCDGEDG